MQMGDTIERLMKWMEDIGKEDKTKIPTIIKGMKNMLQEICMDSASKGDIATVSLFKPWGIRNSLPVCESAAASGRLELCKMLATSREKVNIMAVVAARRGHTDVVKHMLDNGCDIVHMVADSAVEYAQLDVVSLLLSHGYNDKRRMSVMAERHGHHDVTSVLKRE